MYRIGALLIGYLLGGVQTAILYGRIKGIDIRQQGSGNAGTTNAARVLGKKAGAIVLIGDILKTLLAIFIARLLFGSSHPIILISLYTGIGAILGHSYPAFFGFKGGKGIAVAGGMIIGTDWRLLLVCGLVLFGCFAITRIVSLSSLIGSVSIPIALIIFYCGESGSIPYEVAILGLFIMAFIFYRHRSNIERLINGTEAKFQFKK